MSYHCIDNAFTGLTFSDLHLGINGCVLTEVLHIMQHGLFLYAGAGLFGTKGELQKKGTKRKKLTNEAKKVLPAKLKVEAKSDSDILDNVSSDHLTSDEDYPGVKDRQNADNTKSPEASGVFDDSSHMFGEGGVFEEYSMVHRKIDLCRRLSLESLLILFKLILTASQRHTG